MCVILILLLRNFCLIFIVKSCSIIKNNKEFVYYYNFCRNIFGLYMYLKMFLIRLIYNKSYIF